MELGITKLSAIEFTYICTPPKKKSVIPGVQICVNYGRVLVGPSGVAFQRVEH